jgi:TatA/E family protein of Tat protein translocase
MPTPGPLELVIILVIALLILGPGKLPDVGSALGKSIKEFRKASSDVQEAVTVNVDTSPLPATPAAAPAPQPAPAAPAAPAAAVAAAVVDAAPVAPVADGAAAAPTATADSSSVTS